MHKERVPISGIVLHGFSVPPAGKNSVNLGDGMKIYGDPIKAADVYTSIKCPDYKTELLAAIKIWSAAEVNLHPNMSPNSTIFMSFAI